MASVDSYRTTQISTASPMELIVMLYDECINSLDKAEKAFSIETPTRIQEINNNILRAEDIITELNVSLDMEKGGAIARNLSNLYDFMVSHLSKANVAKRLKPIQEVRELMNDLREAWQQVAAQEPRGEEMQPLAMPTATVMVRG